MDWNWCVARWSPHGERPEYVVVLGSPASVLPTVYPGLRCETQLTPGYGRTAFQAEEKPGTAESTDDTILSL
jgi:hypothetical protein